MKKIFLTAVSGIFFSTLLVAQSVGINTTTPDASAILDVKSSTKGMLVPRTSTVSRLAIENPAKGLMLYDTTTSSFWFHNGADWNEITIGANVWNITGNAGTDSALNFIGTTDDKPLHFRLNNLWAGEMHPSNGNIFLGMGSGQSNTTAGKNTAIGSGALQTQSFDNDGSPWETTNVAIGYEALTLNNPTSTEDGNSNTAVGTYAMHNNTTGFDNTALGASALYYNETGIENTAIGRQALFSNATGNGNTATGYKALRFNTAGLFNTAIGSDALYSNTTGSSNNAIGSDALYSNSTGSSNTAFGTESLKFNSTGISNTAIGNNALNNNTVGGNNTTVGYYAGNDLSSSDYNTLIGSGAHCSASNSVVIGYNSFTNVNHLALLGNPTTLFTGGYSNWSNFSDGRFKKDIDENVRGLDFIMRLRPVTYHMDVRGLYNFWGISPYGKEDSMVSASSRYLIDEAITKKEAVRMTGFVAQEVEKAARASNYDFDGVMSPTHDKDHYRIAYGEFVVPLVKAVQEQQLLIETLQKQVEHSKLEIQVQTRKQQVIIEEQNKKIEILMKEVQSVKEQLNVMVTKSK